MDSRCALLGLIASTSLAPDRAAQCIGPWSSRRPDHPWNVVGAIGLEWGLLERIGPAPDPDGEAGRITDRQAPFRSEQVNMCAVQRGVVQRQKAAVAIPMAAR